MPWLRIIASVTSNDRPSPWRWRFDLSSSDAIVPSGLNFALNVWCSDFVPAEKFVVLHSENGVIGYGRGTTVEEATPYVVNAGVQPVMMHPYTSIVNHADAFGIIRKGLLDVAVLGAYEVAANGDFANWKNGTSPVPKRSARVACTATRSA